MLPYLMTVCLFAAAPVEYRAVEHVVVSDGDTIAVSIPLTPSITYRAKLRAVDMDTWESFRTRNKVAPFKTFTEAQWVEENKKGDAAKEALKKLLAIGPVYITIKKYDQYGRVLSNWYVYDKQADKLLSVAEYMKANGHTRE